MFVGFSKYVDKYKDKVDTIVLDIDDGITNEIVEVKSDDIKKYIKKNGLTDDVIAVKFITKYPDDDFCTMYCYC